MARRAVFDSGLLAAGFRPSTRRVYARQVLAFTDWCRDNQIDFFSLDELDEALAEFISTCYLDAGSKSAACSTFYGVCMFEPHANKLTLPCAFRCLRGWLRAEPSAPHPPISWFATLGLCAQLLRQGYWDVACGAVIAHHCLLRVNELLSLAIDDVVLPGDARTGQHGVRCWLRLPRTKTGTNQSVDVTHHGVLELLRLAVARARRAGRARLFTVSAAAFRLAFVRVAARFGLRRMVPHSLRHGGATKMLLDGASIEQIMHRGRWESTAANRRYLQSARSLLLDARVHPLLLDVGRRVDGRLAHVFLHPPPPPARR